MGPAHHLTELVHDDSVWDATAAAELFEWRELYFQSIESQDTEYLPLNASKIRHFQSLYWDLGCDDSICACANFTWLLQKDHVHVGTWMLYFYGHVEPLENRQRCPLRFHGLRRYRTAALVAILECPPPAICVSSRWRNLERRSGARVTAAATAKGRLKMVTRKTRFRPLLWGKHRQKWEGGWAPLNFAI